MANIKKNSPKRKKGRAIKWIMLSALVSFFLLIIGYIGVIFAGESWIDENRLTMDQTSVVYDVNGKDAMKLYKENRNPVPYKDIPADLVHAIVDTEDQRFFEHGGVDPLGILRALYKDVIAGGAVEGGSTITQQLAKNTFLTFEKSIFRKAKEAIIAVQLERKYTKEQILEMYLNRIYFGHGAYGVGAAAEIYFGKDLQKDKLTLAESAMLAGLPKAPSNYSPFLHPEAALERRNLVLTLMKQQGDITAEAMNQAKAEPIDLTKRVTDKGQEYQTYIDYLVDEAEQKYGITNDEMYRGGYKIYTTLNPYAQKAMAKVYANDRNFPKGKSDDPNDQVQSGMVMIDPKTGGIAAMIGGRDYAQKGFNRALSRSRQPGSAFKPIAVYGPAIEAGWSPYDMLKDEKMSFGDYAPENYDDVYLGQVTMMKAVEKSINVSAVWLLNEIGLDKGFEFANRLGMDLRKEDRNLSMALGGLNGGVSPLQMAQAYSAFDNNGVLTDAYAITKIVDKNGTVVVEASPAKKVVMSEKTAYYMTRVLEDVVQNGTGKRAQLKWPVAGKTGTTQSGIKGVKGNRDAWFVGYTPDLVAAVWMGYDKPDKNHMLSGSGGGYPARIFAQVMKETLSGMNTKVRDFQRPNGVPELEPPIILKTIADLKGEFSKEDRLIHLTWTPIYPPDEKKVGYRIYRKPAADDNASFEKVGEVIEGQWTDEPNIEGGADQYYVTPFNLKTNQEGDMSNIITVEPPPESLLDIILPGNQQPGQQDTQPGQGTGDGIGTGTGSGTGGTGDGSSNDGTGTPPGEGTTPPGTDMGGTPPSSGGTTPPSTGDGTKTPGGGKP